MFNKLQRYSIRKLTIGAASVLIGITFVGVNANVVHAQSAPPTEMNKTSDTKQANATTDESAQGAATPAANSKAQAQVSSPATSEQGSSQNSQSTLVKNDNNEEKNIQSSSPISAEQKSKSSQKKPAISSTPGSTSKTQFQLSRNSKSLKLTNNSAITPANKPVSPKTTATSPSQPSIDFSNSSQTTQILNTKNKIPAIDVRDSKVSLTNDVTLKPTVPLKGRDQTTTIGSGNNETFFGYKDYNLLINGGETLNNIQGQTVDQATDLFNIPDDLKGKVKFEWVNENNKPITDTNPYDTKWYRDGTTVHDSFDAYIRITYANGDTKIQKVTVGIKSEADQYDEEIFNDIDHLVTHTIDQEDGHHPVFNGGDGDIPHEYQLTWGYDVNEIVWNNNVTPDQINLFKNIIASFQTSGHHRSPAFSLNTTNKYAIAKPGMNIVYKDGSWSEDIRPGDDISRNPKHLDSHVPVPYAWVYRVLAKNADPHINPANNMSTSMRQTFVAGDPSVFTSQTAKEQLTNLAENELFSFNEQYTWVVKDNSVVQPHSIDGIQITGYRSLTKNDYQNAGLKDFYIMIGYKKVNGVQDGYDIVKIPVNLIAGIHATGENKVFDNQEVNKSQIIGDLKDGSITLHSQNDTEDEHPLIIPNNLAPNDFVWLDNDKNIMTANPIYAGTYYLRIKANSTFLKKLAADNSTAGIDPSKDTDITYIIKKASITANLSGSNKKYFSNTPFTSNDLYNSFTDSTTGTTTSSINVTVPVFDNNIITYKLKDGDYNWYIGNGTTKIQYINVDNGLVLGPVGVGTYYLKLSQQGKQNLINEVNNKIKDLYPERDQTKFANSLDWSNAFVDNDFSNSNTYATFTIKQLSVHFHIIGHGQKIYDGQPATLNSIPVYKTGDKKNNGIFIDSNYPGLGENPSGSGIGIENGDLIWTDGKGSQITNLPVNVGNYQATSFSKNFINTLKNVLILAAGKGIDGRQNIIISINPKEVSCDVSYDITPASEVIVHYYDDTDSNDPIEIKRRKFTSSKENPGSFIYDLNDFTKNWNYTQAGWAWEKQTTVSAYPTKQADGSISSNGILDGNYYVADYNIYLKAANSTTETITRQVKYVDGFGNALTPTDSTLPAATATPLKLEYMPIIDNTGKVTGYNWQLATADSKIDDFTAPKTITVDGETYSLDTANSHYALRADDQPTNLIINNNGTFSLTQTDLATLAKNTTYTITLPYLLNFDINYTGTDGKTYDGQVGTINPSKVNSWQEKNNNAQLTLPTGETLNIPIDWDANTDFHWIDKDGNNASAPTDVGTYYIALTQDGINKLKAANSNYKINNITGKITYTINPQPEPPTQPTEPTKPTQPTGNGGQNTDAPTQPTQASQNTKASSPAKPTAPAKPTSPAKPSKPAKPHKPSVKPNKPGKPTKPNKSNNKPSKGKSNKVKTTNGPIHGEKNISKKSSPWSRNNMPYSQQMPEGIRHNNHWSNNNTPLSAEAPENNRNANAGPEVDNGMLNKMMVRPETRRTDRYDQNRHSFFGKKGMLPETGEDHANHNILTAVGMAITALVGLFGFASRRKKKDE